MKTFLSFRTRIASPKNFGDKVQFIFLYDGEKDTLDSAEIDLAKDVQQNYARGNIDYWQSPEPRDFWETFICMYITPDECSNPLLIILDSNIELNESMKEIGRTLRKTLVSV